MKNYVFSNNIGHPFVTLILPFSFDVPKKRRHDSLFEISNDENYVESYTSYDILDEKCPKTDTLKQFYLKDMDEYSVDYLKLHPHCRTTVKNKFTIKDAELSATVSVRTDGYGSVILITKSLKPLSVDSLLKMTKECHKLLTDGKSFDTKAILKDYFANVHGIKDVEIDIGTPYPFYDVYDEFGEIGDLESFIDENFLPLYGLLHQDVTGWRRTKPECAKQLLDVNLSRRSEYAFFLTAIASLEIDNKDRMLTIKKFANEQKVSCEFMQVKLIIERILSLETLVIQKFLLLSIDSDVAEIIMEQNATSAEVMTAKSKISNDLCDYYNIRSQNESHVSGVEWIDYGQKKFGIEKIHDSLMSRLSLLETISKDKDAERTEKGAFFLSLFSLLLSLSTIISICEWIFKAPHLSTVDSHIIWYITGVTVLLVGAVMILLFFRYNIKKKHIRGHRNADDKRKTGK